MSDITKATNEQMTECLAPHLRKAATKIKAALALANGGQR